MIKCCKDEWHISMVLPFWKNFSLIFDYYDGPLEGVAECGICGQYYYYKLLSWDEATQDNRKFEFFKVECFPEIVNRYSIVGELPFYLQQGQLFAIKKKILNEVSSMTASNLCKSDDHFHTGTWCACPSSLTDAKTTESSPENESF